MSWIDDYASGLAALDAAHLKRVRRVVVPEQGARMLVNGRSMLAFCSNDYLGLSGHEACKAAVREAVGRYGVGAGASPMVSGYSAANAALEDELAEFVQLPRALYFYAGYATNASIVPALVSAGDAIFSDELNHACLIDGARLSRAAIHRFSHADLAALDLQLSACTARRRLIVSDAVFSMDGDVADIAALLALAERHDALLLLDDAHGFGVLGPRGRGTLAAAGFVGGGASPRVLYMATLGKALGVAGAFVAGPSGVVEWLLQKTRSYTYATAAPAMLAEALRASLRVVASAEGDALRSRLASAVSCLRAAVAPGANRAIDAAGWRLMPSATAIQPLLIGGNEESLGVMSRLQDAGLWVPAIRPPTVAVGTARLRIALSAAHGLDDVRALAGALIDIARDQKPTAARMP